MVYLIVYIQGIQLQGTPFRYINVNNYKYFMHDLVWQTFYGVPEDGYVVRHKNEYTQLRPRKVYSNHLANLELYIDVIRTRYLPIEINIKELEQEEKE